MKKPIVSFDRVYQKTSKALGVSYTSVHHIMNGKRPCKSNRPKERAKILDDFDHCVIKRTIHGLYSTFSLLKKANNFFTNFWHSRDKSDFLPILQKMQNITIIYERVLYDQVFIINDRCNYMRKIKSFREAGYDIVYLDETLVTKLGFFRAGIN
jgi:hypothetical protein